MDPPGATPIFLALTAEKPAKVRRQLAWQAAGVSLLVIAIFALFGRFILNYLNISIEALQAAGGLLLRPPQCRLKRQDSGRQLNCGL